MNEDAEAKEAGPPAARWRRRPGSPGTGIGRRPPLVGLALCWLLALGLLAGILFGPAACARLEAGSAAHRYERVEPVAGATERLGDAGCQRCHGHQPAPEHHRGCEQCHGPGALHVRRAGAPGAIRFPDNAACLDCHERGSRSHLDWAASPHRRAGLLCSSCHDPHDSEPGHLRAPTTLAAARFARADSGTGLCVDCHPEVAARLDLPSHHPVREGLLACFDCHPPHARASGGPGPRNASCTGCHAEQEGPWIHEHLPVAEDCGLCHVPHGSSAPALLEASQPGACVSCHTVAELGATHRPQAFVTRCTDCHGAIHGSYADPFLRR